MIHFDENVSIFFNLVSQRSRRGIPIYNSILYLSGSYERFAATRRAGLLPQNLI